MLDGWKWRAEQENMRRDRSESVAAYFVAHLLNFSGKVARRRIEPADLIKPLRVPAEKRQNKDDDEEYLRSLFGKRIGGEHHSNSSGTPG